MTDTAVIIHPTADVRAARVGSGTRIWQFVVVADGATIGSHCNVCSHCFIESGATIGDRVTIKNGVHVWDGVSIEDDVFVGPGVAFTNDRFPKSRVHPAAFDRTVLRRGASIGANATLLPGIEVGRNALVGAGAVVTKTVPENAIVQGNPARIVGYIGTDRRAPTRGDQGSSQISAMKSRVRGVALVRLKTVDDMRGALCVAEANDQIPFVPRRFFSVFNVPSREVRGEHAHKTLEEFLVCVRGTCSVYVDDGTSREEFELNSPSLGLYVPPMVWRVHYKYSADAILVVMASQPYDPNDYIRAYEDFLAAVGSMT